MAAANPIYLPLRSSNLDKVESAFLTQDGLPHYQATVALGNTSRVSDGQCMDRHFNTGACWGTFSGENTRFVANKDHDTACALEENRLWASAVGSTLGGADTTNTMLTYASSPAGSGLQMGLAGNGCTARSYGSYSNCPNCSLSGSAIYNCGCQLSNPKAIWATDNST